MALSQTARLVSPRARIRRRMLTASAISLLLLGLVAAIHLGIGSRFIWPSTVVRALIAYDPTNFDHKVLVQLRLLRLLGGLLVGAALGMAGALLQLVTRNPLGEPHFLGLNAGAAFAVVLASALGLSNAAVLGGAMGRPLVAALGAAGLFSVIITASSAGRDGLTPLKVILCGVAFSAFAASLTSAILILDEQTLMDLRLWLAGDLAGLSYQGLAYAAAPAVLAAVLAVLITPQLNALALGENVASGLGVDLKRTRLGALAAAALLCGAAVSLAGPVGFVGLVAPHMVRTLVSRDARALVPLSAVAGAILLLAADAGARTLLAPRELATGIMTAVMGAPVFLYIVTRYFR